MAKRREHVRSAFGNGLLNTIALLAVILPVFSFGFFLYGYLGLDHRPAAALKVIPAYEEPKLFDEPLVSITFDDGWKSMYDNAAPILEKNGIRATFYVMPGAFTTPQYMSLNQIRSLKAVGHEIGSHTMTHLLLPNATGERLVYELQTSKAELVKEGLVPDKVNFAPPESETSNASDDMVIDTYYSQRNTFGDLENGVNEYDVNLVGNSFNRYDITAYAVNQKTTLEHLKTALNFAFHNDGWLVLVYHQVDGSGERYSVTPETFRDHMKLIVASKIKVATLGSVLEAYERKSND